MITTGTTATTGAVEIAMTGAITVMAKTIKWRLGMIHLRRQYRRFAPEGLRALRPFSFDHPQPVVPFSVALFERGKRVFPIAHLNGGAGYRTKILLRIHKKI